MGILPEFKLKKPVIIATAVVAFIVALVAVAPMFFGAKSYRAWLEHKLPREIAANVSVGKFKFRLLPLPTYTIEDLKFVSSDSDFRGLDIFSAKKIEGRISVIGLLKGRIETDVKVSGAVFDYRVQGEVSNLAAMLGLTGIAPASGGVLPPPSLPTEAKPASDLPFKAMPMPAVENEQPAPPTPTAIPEAVPAQPAPMPPPTDAYSAPSQPVQPTAPSAEGVQPTSIMDLIPVRSAYALAPFSKENYALVINSIEISDSVINVHAGEEPKIAMLSRALISIKNISIGAAAASGLAAPNGGGVVASADVGVRGMLGGAEQNNANFAARVSFDSQRRELQIKDCKGQFEGAPITLDVMWSAASLPNSFDIHFATTALTPAMVLRVRESARPLLLALGWQGSASFDATVKGTRDSYELTAIMDGTASSVAAGRYFSKSAGVLFKISVAANADAQNFLIKESTVSLGDDNFSVQGERRGGEQPSLSLRVEGEAIDDAVLRTHFPVLSNLDVAEEVSGSVAFASAPVAGEDTFSGSIRAKKLGFAGIVLDEVDTSFAMSAESVLITPLKGKFLGGDFSGSAKVLTGDETLYSAEGVVEGLEAESIPALRGSVRGKGALVVQASTNGANPAALSANASLQGTYVIQQGSFQGMKIASTIFNEDSWRTLEGAAGVIFDESKKQSLATAEDSFSNLTAAYELAAQNLKISSATWAAPKYSVEGFTGAASLSPSESSALRADGTMIVPKSIAVGLTADKLARDKILDKQERLVIPFTVAGTISSSVCSMDGVKLDAILAANAPKTKEAPVEQKQAGKGKKGAAATPAKSVAAEPPPKEAPAEVLTTPTKSTAPVAPTVPAPQTPAPAMPPAPTTQPTQVAPQNSAPKMPTPPVTTPTAPAAPAIPQGPAPTTPESGSAVPAPKATTPSIGAGPAATSSTGNPRTITPAAPVEKKAAPSTAQEGQRPTAGEPDTRVQDPQGSQIRSEAEDLMKVIIGQ